MDFVDGLNVEIFVFSFVPKCNIILRVKACMSSLKCRAFTFHEFGMRFRIRCKSLRS